MTIIDLAGCATRPIGSYLKALGVLRLVGEQLDAQATGSWVGDTFRLETVVEEADLVTFFVDRYAPTPLVSPWNGGSGYAPKDKAAIEAIDAVLANGDARFSDYREAIETAQALVAAASWNDGGKDRKKLQIARCRAALPDRAVEWLDASVVLTNDRAVFPPLFGTGGNDGRLEFSSNFMQRLVELFISPRRRDAPDTVSLLRDALFAENGSLEKGTSGQFDPNSVVPPVTSASGRSEPLSNPWDFVLLMEGGLVFASAAARRLGTSTNIRAAMPFCVDSSSVGSASSAEGEESRGEIWAPVWTSPATASEVERLIGEGRAKWGRDQAVNGVDFAKSVATLGVDRGIDRFVRHGIVQRYGLTFFAVPMGEVIVGNRPEVNVLLPIDDWLRRLKRQLPAAATGARRRVEAAEYRAAAESSSRSVAALQQVLIELADLEMTVARSNDKGEAPWPVGRSFTRLPADDWLPYIDDGSPEFRLAVALASARDRFPSGELDAESRNASSLATILRPVELDGHANLTWSQLPSRVGGVDRRPLHKVLADVLVERSIRGGQRVRHENTSDNGSVNLAFETGRETSPTDLLDLTEGRVDISRLATLMRGMLLLNWRPARRARSTSGERYRPKRAAEPRWRTTPAVAALMPFFHGRPIEAELADGTLTEVTLDPRPEWPRLLAIGRVDLVLDAAVQRLRVEGLRPGVATIRPTTAEAEGALSIAVLCRISSATATRFLRQTCPSDSRIREFAIQDTAMTKETS